MKVRIKCSGLIVELEEGSAIDYSFYEEIKVQEVEQKQEVAKNKRGRKRKNNDNE